MFSLIITVVSIALASALAVSTVYYLSDKVRFARAKVDAAEYMNVGETIKGAINMYRAGNGNAMPETIQDLVDTEYLGSVPEGSWVITGDNVTQDNVDVDSCELVNQMIHGESVVYACSEMPAGQPGCCDSEL